MHNLPRGVKRARPLDDNGDYERHLFNSRYHSQTMGLIPGSAQAPALPSTPILINFAKKRCTDKQAVQEVQCAIDAARLTLVTLCSRAGMAARSSSASKPLTIRIPARARPSCSSKPALAQLRDERPNYDSQTGLLTRGFSYSTTLLWQSGLPLEATPKIRLRVPAYLRMLRAMSKLEVAVTRSRKAGLL